MHQNPRPLDMPQKLVSQTNSGVGSFDKAGNVGHHEFVIVPHPHEPKIRVFGGERVIGNFGRRTSHPAQECGLARIRFAQKSNIGNEFEFQHDLAIFARAAILKFARGLIGRGCKSLVATSALAAARDNDRLAFCFQVAQNVAVFGIAHDGAGWHQHQGIVATTPCSQVAFAVSTAFGIPVSMADNVGQASEIAINSNDDVAPFASVTAIRATARNVSFPPEAHATVSAITRLTKNFHPIDEHRLCLNNDQSARTWLSAGNFESYVTQRRVARFPDAVNSMIDLSDHNVLVTGSTQGVGRAIAIGLARAGANIVFAWPERRRKRP